MKLGIIEGGGKIVENSERGVSDLRDAMGNYLVKIQGFITKLYEPVKARSVLNYGPKSYELRFYSGMYDILLSEQCSLSLESIYLAL